MDGKDGKDGVKDGGKDSAKDGDVKKGAAKGGMVPPRMPRVV